MLFGKRHRYALRKLHINTVIYISDTNKKVLNKT